MTTEKTKGLKGMTAVTLVLVPMNQQEIMGMQMKELGSFHKLIKGVLVEMVI